ncbi:hypothetical protein CC86DRAFT_9846 [Ophiobolus disseminans]|uniref:Uncharacterized protein n=1 Tax=Ophiobolus disseminans TaxID=1469910 RepID=A0A6A7AL44_9PLEO|nr:hypothetical protein CC86DRAFT_9846 [Ophiobolus disseminans]
MGSNARLKDERRCCLCLDGNVKSEPQDTMKKGFNAFEEQTTRLRKRQKRTQALDRDTSSISSPIADRDVFHHRINASHATAAIFPRLCSTLSNPTAHRPPLCTRISLCTIVWSAQLLRIFAASRYPDFSAPCVRPGHLLRSICTGDGSQLNKWWHLHKCKWTPCPMMLHVKCAIGAGCRVSALLAA